MADQFDVLAVSSPGEALNETGTEEGVSTYPIRLTRKITPFQDLKSLIQMIVLLIRERPDIVHSHTPKAGLIAMVAAWITRVPHRIHTVAGMPLVVTTGIKRQLLMAMERLTCRCATTVIPNSRGLRNYLLEQSLTDPETLIFFNPGSSNGIDLTFFARTPEVQSKGDDLRQALSITTGIVFLFAGRIVRDKGIEEMAAAFNRLYTETQSVSWIIAGDFDTGLNQISSETRSLLESHPAIHLLGFSKDIRTPMAACDVVVLPSYREGLPQVLLQACAMDRPCITTDIMGCNEVIQPERNGLIVPAQNADLLYGAMKRMWSEPELVAQLKSDARHAILNYDQPKIWAQIRDLYHRLLTTKGH
jgi:glycosyltransferase involved in cell wall biosynthesis